MASLPPRRTLLTSVGRVLVSRTSAPAHRPGGLAAAGHSAPPVSPADLPGSLGLGESLRSESESLRVSLRTRTSGPGLARPGQTRTEPESVGRVLVSRTSAPAHRPGGLAAAFPVYALAAPVTLARCAGFAGSSQQPARAPGVHMLAALAASSLRNGRSSSRTCASTYG